jgi:hypothetical protein
MEARRVAFGHGNRHKRGTREQIVAITQKADPNEAVT